MLEDLECDSCKKKDSCPVYELVTWLQESSKHGDEVAESFNSHIDSVIEILGKLAYKNPIMALVSKEDIIGYSSTIYALGYLAGRKYTKLPEVFEREMRKQ